jgi:hypothetical protein
MALFDTLLAARDAIQAWLDDHPISDDDGADTRARNRQMLDAWNQLSRTLRTIENQGLKDSLNKLQTDAETLNDTATRLQSIEKSFETVNDIVKDVGVVVGIVQKLLPGGG